MTHRALAERSLVAQWVLILPLAVLGWRWLLAGAPELTLGSYAACGAIVWSRYCLLSRAWQDGRRRLGALLLLPFLVIIWPLQVVKGFDPPEPPEDDWWSQAG